VQRSGGSSAQHDLAKVVPSERAKQSNHATVRPTFDRAQVKVRGWIRRRLLCHRAQNAKGRRGGVKDPTPLAQHDLDRSPSEIEERGTTETAAQLCARACIGQARFLVTRDDLNVDAKSRANLGDERVSIARLAHGAGRDRKHGLWFVPFNHRDQLLDRVQGAFERSAREATGSKDGLADPGHPFGALDHHQARATVHIRN
jgi:hypothetical protein